MLGYRISYGYLEDKDLLSMYDNYMDYKQDYRVFDFLKTDFESVYSFLSICAEIRLRNLQTVDEVFLELADTIISLKQEDEPEIKADDIYSEIKHFRDKYRKSTGGRLRIPRNTQELWAEHKYSIMARDYNLYKSIGIRVGKNKTPFFFDELLYLLSKELRTIPAKKSLYNALQHMWGYISKYSRIEKSLVNSLSLDELFYEIQKCTWLCQQEYLMQQTALSELEIWVLAYKEKENIEANEKE